VVGNNTSTSLKGEMSPKPGPRQAHFYVYRLSKSHSADDIKSYCKDRNLSVIDCNEVCINRYTTRSFRLIVGHEGSDHLMDPSFWPKYVMCRPWVWKPKNG
jgi:hypothetical protein